MKIFLGAYGKVYKVLNIATGNFIAMKQIDINDSADKPTVDIGSFQTEVELYRTLEHENIVKYVGAALTEEKVLIYMEYMPGGSLSSMLKQYGSFEESIIRKFTKQILLGINYLHQKGVIHRDIKVKFIGRGGEINRFFIREPIYYQMDMEM